MHGALSPFQISLCDGSANLADKQNPSEVNFKLNLHRCDDNIRKTVASANRWQRPDANSTWLHYFLLSDRLHLG